MAAEEQHVICKGRFGFRSPALLLSTAHLYADHLDLSGWGLGGRYSREIPLYQILQIDSPAPDELLIWLTIGETIHLNLKQAKRWKTEIELLKRRFPKA